MAKERPAPEVATGWFVVTIIGTLLYIAAVLVFVL